MDLISFGELLIDLVASRGDSLSSPGAATFWRAAGGAPANVAAGAARLLGERGQVGFAGRVGDDPLGRYLRSTLESCGVDTSFLSFSPDIQTPVAIVGPANAAGEIEFCFYGPDDGKRLVLLDPEDLPHRPLMESRIVALGGVGLSHPISSRSVLRAARFARSGRALLAFDANWRPALWSDVRDWVGAVRQILPLVDVLKVSANEMDILTGTEHLDEGAALIAEMAHDVENDRPILVAATRGSKGAGYVLYSGRGAEGEVAHSATVEAAPVQAVDPTGAGDAFLAGLLVGLLEAPRADEGGRIELANLQSERMRAILRFANATAALTTTQRGAMAGLPSRKAVQRLLDGRH